MRKLVIAFFLSLYAVVLIQPFIPLINYTINKDFIAKNFCENREKPKLQCHGKCHLAKKVKSQAEQEKKTPSNVKAAEEIVLFCAENTLCFIAASFGVEKTTFSQYKFIDYVEPLASIFQPPQ